jgi:nucleoside-diphosphate-sugar epimerase
MTHLIITGGQGYIGSTLAKRLASEGHALRLVSFFSRTPTIANSDRVTRVQADLRDEANWLALLEDAAAVVHLSWRTDLRAAEADPAGDRALNVEPVLALVRAVERSGRSLPVIFASTVTIIGAKPPIPADEQTPDLPGTVYDRHKLECETIFSDATRRGLLRACSLRLPNVYGYGSGIASTNANRGILNAIMRQAGRGEALTLYGEGKYVRDFIYIEDVVDAFCRGLKSPQLHDGGHYVIASGRGYTLSEAFHLVAQEALRSTGRAVEIRHVPEPHDLYPIERRNFVGNSSLFQRLTGWRPQMELKSGIRDYFMQTAAESTPDPAPPEVA